MSPLKNWQKIVDGTKAPVGVSPSEWMELQAPKLEQKPNFLDLGSPLKAFLKNMRLLSLAHHK